jgi:signal transduction histidine kinase
VPVVTLRWRVIIGGVLWAAGFFILAGVLATAIMVHHWQAAYTLHGAFAQVLPSVALAIVCLAAGFWQVRRGLSPVNQLRRRLSAVHAGSEARVGGSYPTEIQPLVDDLNGLLALREEAVRRAVAKAGDLAHGLKTPLAVLAHEAERAAAEGQPQLATAVSEQVERMRRQIDHHLAHARAAASGAAPGTRSPVRESADGLTRAMQKLYADKAVAIEVLVDPAHAVRTHRQDLDEMLGNLVDNACKWAARRVRIRSSESAAAGLLTIAVEDDGPGLAETLRQAVLQRGVRADEGHPGSGFGLAIVRDLAELYGGRITLTASPLGGLHAGLELPRAD